MLPPGAPPPACAPCAAASAVIPPPCADGSEDSRCEGTGSDDPRPGARDVPSMLAGMPYGRRWTSSGTRTAGSAVEASRTQLRAPAPARARCSQPTGHCRRPPAAAASAAASLGETLPAPLQRRHAATAAAAGRVRGHAHRHRALQRPPRPAAAAATGALPRPPPSRGGRRSAATTASAARRRRRCGPQWAPRPASETSVGGARRPGERTAPQTARL
eukprot:278782-Chlamydomonas_euryale.AAC.10